MSDPTCAYCHMSTFPVQAGWFCVKCHSSIGKDVPTPEPTNDG